MREGRWINWMLLLLSNCATLIQLKGVVASDSVGVGSFVDTERCYANLEAADEDGDGALSSDEYVTFLQLFGSDGFVEEAQSFDDLPLILKGSFNQLACLCLNNGGAADCCVGSNATISTEGASSDEPTEDQVSYLFTVCLTSERAIQQTLGTSTPTEKPSHSPTFVPSQTPTALPSTLPTDAPSTLPSQVPTITPTSLGSDVPTSLPSTKPSAIASDIPTAFGSDFPSVAPSTDPTVVGSGLPSWTPSSTPSLFGSGTPSSGPSLQPSTIESEAPSVIPSLSQSVVESGTPSFAPSLPPSAIESGSPSALASESPSVGPTVAPSLASSEPPSLRPTFTGETFSPTVSASPSTIPTVTPTTSPSAAPITMSPVATVAPVTDAPVTFAPTGTPVTEAPVVVVPTPAPSENQAVSVVYRVAITDDDSTAAIRDLEAAMDILAPQVAVETFPPIRLRRRRLVVDADSPTDIFGLLDNNVTCPDGVPDTFICQDVQHTIILTLRDENDPASISDAYEAAMNEAIENNRLQLALDEVNSDANVFIITGLSISPALAPVVATSPREGLSAGQTAGITIGAVVAVAIIAGLLLIRRRGAEKEGGFPNQQAFAEIDPDQGASLDDPLATSVPAAAVSSTTLGASVPDYGPKSRTSQTAQHTLDGGDAVPVTAEPNEESSSNAGSSGWSSSAGISSLNTTSVDSIDFEGTGTGGATLTEITSASALSAAAAGAVATVAGDAAIAAAARTSEEGQGRARLATRDDLDVAIEQGDWAAVGATAALLAAASDSQSFSSRSRATSREDATSVSSFDAARAAELDHLVDAGDWEGVVLAAARFEASEETSTGPGESKERDSSSALSSQHTTSGSGSSGQSPSASGSVATTPSLLAHRGAIREEVETLVRRVVPEEVDNVDEMMLQFKGREEELVETLRTMQERQVAQKAREEGQKQAKRDARRTAREGGHDLPVPGGVAPGGESVAGRPAPPQSTPSDDRISQIAAAGIGVGSAATAGVAAGFAALVSAKEEQLDSAEDSASSGTSEGSQVESEFSKAPAVTGIARSILDEQSTESRKSSDFESEASGKRRRTALELAIEAGDWEAVGEAAAMMSDNSATTISSEEIGAIATASEGGSTPSGGPKFKVNAIRAAELDEMINRGDWTGVVAAATRFGQLDSSAEDVTARDASVSASASAQQSAESMYGSASESVSNDHDSTSSETEQARQRRIQEEKEALAQAEVWMAIAEQSRQEGTADVPGASDAAAWAISRSLSALKQAEAEGQFTGSFRSEGSGDDGGDKSV